jgi:hypothetical protein
MYLRTAPTPAALRPHSLPRLIPTMARNRRIVVASANVTRASVAVIAGLHAALFSAGTPAQAEVQPKRPNVVVILGDDLGFADLGSFGSEIKTPNLDALAREGVRFANFYTHASCSPTRSMLLSGVDTHLNGLGNMSEWTAPNQRGAGRLRGLPQQPRRHAAAADEGRRLSHLHGRQVAPGQAARPDSRRRAASSATSRCSTGQAATGTCGTSRAPPEVDLHGRRPLPDAAAEGLLRDEDLYRQDDRVHRRQPWRRQTVLRLRCPPGAARSVPPAEGMAQPPRR